MGSVDVITTCAHDEMVLVSAIVYVLLLIDGLVVRVLSMPTVRRGGKVRRGLGRHRDCDATCFIVSMFWSFR